MLPQVSIIFSSQKYLHEKRTTHNKALTKYYLITACFQSLFNIANLIDVDNNQVSN